MQEKHRPFQIYCLAKPHCCRDYSLEQNGILLHSSCLQYQESQIFPKLQSLGTDLNRWNVPPAALDDRFGETDGIMWRVNDGADVLRSHGSGGQLKNLYAKSPLDMQRPRFKISTSFVCRGNRESCTMPSGRQSYKPGRSYWVRSWHFSAPSGSTGKGQTLFTGQSCNCAHCITISAFRPGLPRRLRNRAQYRLAGQIQSTKVQNLRKSSLPLSILSESCNAIVKWEFGRTQTCGCH